MSGQINLYNIYGLLKSEKPKDRTDGLQDLRRLLRHGRNAEALNDKGYHKLFEALFHIVVREKTQYTRAKGTAKATVANRLQQCGQTVRTAVDVGVRYLRQKTVEAIIEHVCYILPSAGAGLFEPVSLDYSKALRCILSYPPHAEHITVTRWTDLIEFCCGILRAPMEEDGNGQGNPDSHASEDDFDNTPGGWRNRSYHNKIRFEDTQLMQCLQRLLETPNAPVGAVGQLVADFLLQFLNFYTTESSAHIFAVQALNRTLASISVNNIRLTDRVAQTLLPLIARLWTTKSAALKEQSLITLMYTYPYLHRHIQSHASCREDAMQLFESMWAELVELLDRDRLQLHDLDYRYESLERPEARAFHSVRSRSFSLRASVDPIVTRPEQAWACLQTIAALAIAMDNQEVVGPHDERSSAGDADAAQKRRRVTENQLSFLVSQTRHPSSRLRIAALQALVFVFEASEPNKVGVLDMGSLIHDLALLSGDDDVQVQCWAMTCAASIARYTTLLRRLKSPKALSQLASEAEWRNIWSVCCRKITATATCRAACYFLSTAVETSILDDEFVVLEMEQILKTIDLQGPAQLTDTSCTLIAKTLDITIKTGTVRRLRPQEKILQWFGSWNPLDGMDKRMSQTYPRLLNAAPVLALLERCRQSSGSLPQTPADANDVPRGAIGRVCLELADRQELLQYLLLAFAEDNNNQPPLAQELISTPSRSLSYNVDPEQAILFDTGLRKILIKDARVIRDNLRSFLEEDPNSMTPEIMSHVLEFALITGMLAVSIDSPSEGAAGELTGLVTCIFEDVGSFLRLDNAKQVHVDVCLLSLNQCFIQAKALSVPTDGAAFRARLDNVHFLANAFEHLSSIIESRMKVQSDNEPHDVLDPDYNDAEDDDDMGMAVSSSSGQHSDLKDLPRTVLDVRCALERWRTDMCIRLHMNSSVDVLVSSRWKVSTFMDYISKLPKSRVLWAESSLTRCLQRNGEHLPIGAIHEFLEYAASLFLSDYGFERSEAVIVFFINTLEVLVDTWAMEDNDDIIHTVYEWVVKITLDKNLASYVVRRRLAVLLSKLLSAQPHHHGTSNTGSTRSRFIEVLRDRDARVTHDMSTLVVQLFRCYPQGDHVVIYQDIMTFLEDNEENLEMFSMRVLTLWRIGMASEATRKAAIYNLIELGNFGLSRPYVQQALQGIAEGCGVDSPRELLQTYISQVIYSWIQLEGSISEFPYAIFGYKTLKDWCTTYREELGAQLLLHGGIAAFIELSQGTLRGTFEDLLRVCFHRAMAYGKLHKHSEASAIQPDKAEAISIETLCATRLPDFNSLLIESFDDTIAVMLYSLRDEGSSPKAFYQSSLLAEGQVMENICGLSCSDCVLPEPPRPHYKARVVIRAISDLCEQAAVSPNKLWTPSRLTYILRFLMSSATKASSPTELCGLIRKLRFLASMAGGAIVQGYPLAMLLHFLTGYVLVPLCSKDAMGVLQYLISHSVHGDIVTPVTLIRATSALVRSLRVLEATDTGTVVVQTSNKWLKRIISIVQENPHLDEVLPAFQALLTLRGLADDKSVDWRSVLKLTFSFSDRSPLDADSRNLLFEAFTDAYDRGGNEGHEFVAQLEVSALAKSIVCHASQLEFSDKNLSNIGKILGMAFASEGSAHVLTEARTVQSHPGENPDLITKTAVLQQMAILLRHPSHVIVGEVEAIVSRIFARDPNQQALQSLPEDVRLALNRPEYHPRTHRRTASDVDDVSKSFEPQAWMNSRTPFTDWSVSLVLTLVRLTMDDPVMGCLAPLVHALDTFGKDLFPNVVLFVLFKSASDTVFKSAGAALAAIFNHNFRTLADNVSHERLALLIDCVLYLRQTAMPNSKVGFDRNFWLPIDYSAAADAAVLCNMPKAALLFTEIYWTKADAVPRHDTYERLLQIFRHIDEPDSYHGVSRTTSLASMMQHYDYEGNGWKSFCLRGAELEAVSRLGYMDGKAAVHNRGVRESLSKLGLYATAKAITAADLGFSGVHSIAWRLEQWDLPSAKVPSDQTALYTVLQQLNFDAPRPGSAACLNAAFLSVTKKLLHRADSPTVVKGQWCSLAALVEVDELTRINGKSEDLIHAWEKRADHWADHAQFSDVEMLFALRSVLFGSVMKRPHLQREQQLNSEQAFRLQARSLLKSCRMARAQGQYQIALSNAAYLQEAANAYLPNDDALMHDVSVNTASVFWKQGESIPAIRMLQQTIVDWKPDTAGSNVRRAKTLAQLAGWMSEARLERPDVILQSYLEVAVQELHGVVEGDNAGRVFNEFASFCEKQLNSSAIAEDFARMQRLRDQKSAEIFELQQLLASSLPEKKARAVKSHLDKAKALYQLDNAEYQRLLENKTTFLTKSAQYYLRCIAASDEYDFQASRFCAFWLANCTMDAVNEIVQDYLPKVPSRKFIPLMNQLSARLSGVSASDSFQGALRALIFRLCQEHPYHSLYQIISMCSTTTSSRDIAAEARKSAALSIWNDLKNQNDPEARAVTKNVEFVAAAYNELARYPMTRRDYGSGSLDMSKVYPKHRVFLKDIPRLRIPPPTAHVPVDFNCDYTDVPLVNSFATRISVANGLSAPKVIVCYGTDARRHKQLVKGGNDDLRQDAIMEQVFQQVDALLQKNQNTRLRNLRIRTYKVLPLTENSGILEWVQQTIPINEYLIPAHEAHHPKDWSINGKCRKHIAEVQGKSNSTRLRAYEMVTEHLHPVMRHFFFDNYVSPDEWYSKRLNYSRSTAAISMLGHVLGLGDRHGHNILLDKSTGEIVHIDLGVSFEQGKTLPIPETVPFRLTRDIVDGFGITGVEGVFRKCCEYTLSVLRNESPAVITILDVLRHDPLYSWTISPLRMKRIQEKEPLQDDGFAPGEGHGQPSGAGRRSGGSEGVEAERALLVVTQKLSKTLSVEATVNELIQQATDPRNLSLIFCGWAAYL
ncbi:Serine/threonine-protein kinase tel1 [Saitoella coloradoensis]